MHLRGKGMWVSDRLPAYLFYCSKLFSQIISSLLKKNYIRARARRINYYTGKNEKFLPIYSNLKYSPELFLVISFFY